MCFIFDIFSSRDLEIAGYGSVIMIVIVFLTFF